jgi:hypothetical protein
MRLAAASAKEGIGMTSKLLTGNATDLWPAFLAAANRTSDSYLANENGTGTRAEFEAAFAEQERLMAAIIGLPPALDAMIIRLRTLLWFKAIGDPETVLTYPGPYDTDEDKIVRRLCRDLAALAAEPVSEAGPLSSTF